MNYELALKLKEAGFPQNGNIILCGMHPVGDCREWEDECKETHVVKPTLSGLIEACEPNKADDFNIRIFGGECEACLIYHGYFEGWNGIERDEDGAVSIDLRIIGKTPEAAVANLYLALNKK